MVQALGMTVLGAYLLFALLGFLTLAIIRLLDHPVLFATGFTILLYGALFWSHIEHLLKGAPL